MSTAPRSSIRSLRVHTGRLPSGQQGNAMRGLLLLLIGALLGANAVYFLLVRDADCRCADNAPAIGTPGNNPATIPVPGAPSTAAPPANTRPKPFENAWRRAVTPRRAAAPPPSRTPAATGGVATPPPASASPGGLLVPVSGIATAALSDTFNERRGTDRVHEALDIMAPAGTPVLAVADGHVEKLFDSDQGGLTIYQFDPTGTYAYYYAHLQGYAPGLEEGAKLRRGQVIGYVGSTGNANAEAPHLHFAVFLLGPEKSWWKGTPVNPYPLLTGNRSAQ